MRSTSLNISPDGRPFRSIPSVYMRYRKRYRDIIFFLNANQDSSLPLLIITFVIIRGGGVLEM